MKTKLLARLALFFLLVIGTATNSCNENENS